MDGTTNPTGTPTHKDYKSRPGALAWFFRKSRDRWKSSSSLGDRRKWRQEPASLTWTEGRQ